MHSSTYQGNVGPGGSDSQNISPGVTESQGGYVGYTEGPAPTVHSERASPSNPSLALAPSDISWPYIQAGSLKDESLGFENHGHPASTSSMIGPTSTFYDSSSSSQRLLDNDLQQYQQWWDAFGSQGSYHVVVQETYGQGATHHNNQGSIQYNPVANQYGTQHTSAPYAEAISSMPTTSMIGAINLPPSTFAPRAAHQPPPQHRQTQAHSYIPPATSQTTQTANPITSYQQNPQQSKQAQHNVPLQPQTQGQARPVIHQPQPQPPQQTKPAVAQEKSTEKPQQVIQQPRQPAPVNPSRGAKKRDRSSRTGRSASGSKANGSVTKSRSQDVAIVARQVRFKASPQEPQVNPSAAQAPTTSVSRVTKKRKRETNHSASGGEMFQISQSSSEEEGEGEDDVPYPTGNGGITVGVGGLGVERPGKANPQRLSGACSHCKRLKMKCEFPPRDDTCRRCRSSGHACIVEGRKLRTGPNKREYLLAQIRQKDAIIESLLKQLHNPYVATPLSIASYRLATSPADQNNKNVIAWLDRLQASVSTAGGKGGATAFQLDARAKITGTGEESDDDGPSNQAIDVVPPSDDEGGDADDEQDPLNSSSADFHVPIDLIADLSLSNSKIKNGKNRLRKEIMNEETLDDDNVGVANETYFMPGPATDLEIRATLIEQHSPPEILVHGLVGPEDVDRLFEIFYNRVNPFISLLDPVLHTPASTFARCPFLFTVICAISSRYYAAKSEIYPIAMHFAKHSAANALIDGWKSVELCQAYILMSIYAVPARRWEEDRSWLYTGLAIRIATDLNLHQISNIKPQSEKQEREILNRTRVWMICYNLDRSTATQFGKPSTIKEDYILRNAKDWYKKSRYNLPYDVHLCAYSALLQIVARFHDEIFSDPSSPSGLNKRVDFRTVTLTHDANLTAYHEEWSRRFDEDSNSDDRSCKFRCSLLPFLVAYSRLVMFSFGFQQAFLRGMEPGNSIFFTKCLDSAKDVIKNMIDGLAPSGYMRYAPDGHFVFASFASAFLLKLLRPEFASLLPKEQELEIFDLIGRLIQTLSSPEIAIDDRHTPKLYARFLAGLLSRHRKDGATAGRLHTQQPPSKPPPQSTTHTFSQSIPVGSFAVNLPQGSPSTSSTATLSQSTEVQGSQQFTTPIYQPEATFTTSTGAIHFGGDFDYAGFFNGGMEEDSLAALNALKNPAFWDNVLMPGFPSWSDAGTPMSSHSTPPPPNMQTHPIMNGGGYTGMYPTSQLNMF